MKKSVTDMRTKRIKYERGEGEELDKVSEWLDSNMRWGSRHSPDLDDPDRYDNDEDVDDLERSSVANLTMPGPVKDEPYKYSSEKCTMKCEWLDCGFEISDVEVFVQHVEQHVEHAEVRENEEKETLYCCLWESCGFDCTDWWEAARHITYHAYHTKLKSRGASTLRRVDLPECVLDYAGRNLLPDLGSEFSCEWDDCDATSNNYHRYLLHVQAHVHLLPSTSLRHYVCLWTGCKKTCKSGAKLREHVRVHTQERMVGCPICGGTFTSKTRLFEHCKRQSSHDKKEFQCSYCRRNYPSEALLRVHMRFHVNVHKCPMCDMTCPYPSSLSRHIRYRHIDSKPFRCNFCSHKSKTQRDLEHHQLTHSAENFWVCDKGRCDFECRSKGALQQHYLKHHMTTEPTYICHICDNKYLRGNELTKHLKKEHSYRWASGHTRFKYLQCEDGLFRLQTIRYESIEVTKEMMNPTAEPPTSKRFKYKKKSSHHLMIEEDEEEKEKGEGEAEQKQEGRKEDRFVNDKGLTSIDSDHSNDSFGESLKKHLGLTASSNFIHVVKAKQERD